MNKIQIALNNHIKALEDFDDQYRPELAPEDTTTPIVELIDNADLDTVDFNIGYEQGYMRGLETALKIFNQDIIDAIDNVVSYSIEDEQEHWEEDNKPANHIYHSLLTLNNLITSN